MESSYLELIPIILVGLLAGFMGALDNKDDMKQGLREGLKRVVISSFLCVVCYSILSATDLPYLAKVGVSACVGFLGLDKAVGLVKEFLSLRKGGK